MAGISLKNIRKVYHGNVTAVKDFNLEIDDKEFIILVGPSGCGKSTVLRMIAGLEEITSGKLYIGDKFVNDTEPKDRDIAMVFQNYALYPHMSVYENMAFGLRRRKISKDQIDAKIREAAKILDIEHLLARAPKALSGGQRQRVALGRAMVRNPSVFLLDEPLSNLDAKLRTSMRTELIKLHKKLGTTFIYVTHDQIEAITMGDRIVVMNDGLIQQVDTPVNLYNNPCNMFVAGFIGSPQMNFLTATVSKDGDEFVVICHDTKLPVPTVSKEVLSEYVGKEVILGIRPEDLHPAEESDVAQEDNVIMAELEVSEMMGSEIHLFLNFCGEKLISKASSRFVPKEDTTIPLTVDCTKLHVFDMETEEKL